MGRKLSATSLGSGQTARWVYTSVQLQLAQWLLLDDFNAHHIHLRSFGVLPASPLSARSSSPAPFQLVVQRYSFLVISIDRVLLHIGG
jgi:hypothetical protein